MKIDAATLTDAFLSGIDRPTLRAKLEERRDGLEKIATVLLNQAKLLDAELTGPAAVIVLMEMSKAMADALLAELRRQGGQTP